MMNLFFSKEGTKIVCGGTTSNVVSRYLGQPIIASLDYHDPDVPPISRIKGVDLTTEGVITLQGAHLRRGLSGSGEAGLRLGHPEGRREPDCPRAV